MGIEVALLITGLIYALVGTEIVVPLLTYAVKTKEQRLVKLTKKSLDEEQYF